MGMDELSDEDKTTVARARKIQRFLSQPFNVAEAFTGMKGKYVPLKETIRGFKEIIDGLHDELPESVFLFVGAIDEAVQKAAEAKAAEEAEQKSIEQAASKDAGEAKTEETKAEEAKTEETKAADAGGTEAK
jgi:hypothetical protein